MYEQAQPSYAGPQPAGAADVAGRARFITRTYQHLLGAILLFTGVEVALFQSGLSVPIARAMLSVPWLLVLGAFMVAGWMFSGIAARAQGLGAQYAALAGYVLAEALIFVPLLYIVESIAPGAIGSAAALTLVGFGALTGIAMTTAKDFSAMGGILRWIGAAAILLIVGSLIFGFSLGMLFSFAMVVFAGATILFSTSKILRRYPEDRYVSASLELFASVALMFWYVLRIFSRR
jgi:FtsH-binding integral membrane protein